MSNVDTQAKVLDAIRRDENPHNPKLVPGACSKWWKVTGDAVRMLERKGLIKQATATNAGWVVT